MLAMPITYLPILSKTTKLTKNVHKNKQNTLNYIFNLSLKNHKNKKLIGVVFVILLICYNLWSNTIADWRSFSNLLSHIELKMLKYFNKKFKCYWRGKYPSLRATLFNEFQKKLLKQTVCHCHSAQKMDKSYTKFSTFVYSIGYRCRFMILLMIAYLVYLVKKKI